MLLARNLNFLPLSSIQEDSQAQIDQQGEKRLWWSQLVFKKGRAKKINANHSQVHLALKNLLHSLTITDGADGGIPVAGHPDPFGSDCCT